MQVQAAAGATAEDLLYVEGLGRQLLPAARSVAEPPSRFSSAGCVNRSGRAAAWRALQENAPSGWRSCRSCRILLYDALQQSQRQHTQFDRLYRQFQQQHRGQGQARFLLGIGGALLIGGSLLLESPSSTISGYAA
jgi:predicted unusual protein kinase regulating ubiquinone biosynthesis (AarF/ABC1/UbiB family)